MDELDKLLYEAEKRIEKRIERKKENRPSFFKFDKALRIEAPNKEIEEVAKKEIGNIKAFGALTGACIADKNEFDCKFKLLQQKVKVNDFEVNFIEPVLKAEDFNEITILDMKKTSVEKSNIEVI